jgi:hypothetical protein
MTISARYLFSASMDVTPEREALFNEVYDTEHIPMLQDVPGVISVARFKPARRGARRWIGDAGRNRCARTPATAGTSCTDASSPEPPARATGAGELPAGRGGHGPEQPAL